LDYPFAPIETKWLAVWDQTGAHHTDLTKPGRKFYGLVMFSYPSARKWSSRKQ
jgi:leucyl-tRNA synthetase